MIKTILDRKSSGSYHRDMKYILCCLLFCFVALTPKTYAADIDPRVKMVGKVALYGTAGGALLGLASLAFDGKGRNIARGASLGLYAGIIFGAYVIVSHYQLMNPSPIEPGSYGDDADSPYSEDEQLWRQMEEQRFDFSEKRRNRKSLKIKDIPIYLNVLKFRF